MVQNTDKTIKLQDTSNKLNLTLSDHHTTRDLKYYSVPYHIKILAMVQNTSNALR